MSWAAISPICGEIEALRVEENKRHETLEKDLISSLTDMQSSQALNGESDTLDAKLGEREAKINSAIETLMENQLRIFFLTKFESEAEKSADPRKDAASILLNMSHFEIMENVQSQTESKVWLFETYLAIAMRDIMEKSDKFGDFVKAYMEFSSLRNPKPPQKFLEKRTYVGKSDSPLIGPPKPAISESASLSPKYH